MADTYRAYLDVALDEPVVTSLTTFACRTGTPWLQEDYPRQDGAKRRPLPFDQNMEPTAAFVALQQALIRTPGRHPWQTPPRA